MSVIYSMQIITILAIVNKNYLVLHHHWLVTSFVVRDSVQ